MQKLLPFIVKSKILALCFTSCFPTVIKHCPQSIKATMFIRAAVTIYKRTLKWNRLTCDIPLQSRRVGGGIGPSLESLSHSPLYHSASLCNSLLIMSSPVVPRDAKVYRAMKINEKEHLCIVGGNVS